MSKKKTPPPNGPTKEDQQSAAKNGADVPPAPPETPKTRRERVTEFWLSFRNKIGILGFMLALLVLLIAGATYLSSQRAGTNNSNPSPQLIIVQLNDIYRLDAVRAGKRGGLARVVALLRQLKTQNPGVPVIVLHAGDFLSPSLESSLFHGSQMIDAMNFINDVAPLYVVPGNHAF